MEKVDLKAERQDLYSPPRGRFVEVDVPAMTFLAVDGHGDPNTSEDEGPLLRALHQDHLPQQGLVPIGLHHEIYLNDPRRTEPSKLKVVLRQPVAARLEDGTAAC